MFVINYIINECESIKPQKKTEMYAAKSITEIILKIETQNLIMNMSIKIQPF